MQAKKATFSRQYCGLEAVYLPVLICGVQAMLCRVSPSVDTRHVALIMPHIDTGQYAAYHDPGAPDRPLLIRGSGRAHRRLFVTYIYPRNIPSNK